MEKLLTGRTFGRWSVGEFESFRGNRRRPHYHCVCSCGTRRPVAAEHLLRGHSKSCGCLARDVTSARCRTHGSYTNPTYRIWHNMVNRCHNSNHPDHAAYGARGVVACESWRQSFESFFSDMGDRPSPQHSLDRYPDNDGPYSPENCRWATATEQGRNKRTNRLLTFRGETMPMIAWADRLGLSAGTIHARLKMGWTVEDALGRPLRVIRRKAGSA